ncbi:MAG: ketoacyl-ACP synthase III [Deltaproteobacteria bacterium]|nr:ketoacyl-ACP synthase III [Deltaproteobacteria bacterium]
MHLHGIGHFHPPNVIDNAFLESLDIGTTEDWITSRVGIHARRTVLPLDYIRTTKNRDLRAAVEAAEYTNARTGALAAQAAMARAGVSPAQIGMVVAGGCSPDHCIPAEASAVARELGIEAPAFDLHSACSTFGAQLHFLGQLGTALPDFVLCVVPENTTRIVDYADRSSAILFGDATAAAVVSTRHPGRARLVHSEFGGSPEGALDVTIPRTGHFAQNGSKVQKFAIKRMTDLFLACRDHLSDEAAARLVYVGHQANLTMLEAVARRSDLAPDRHWFNIDRFGNQAAAGAPTVLSERWDSVQPGEHVAVVVVGSGLSWSSLLFEFEP